MFKYSLTENSTWKHLPWRNINNRIFTLQTKIYKASQECNQNQLKYYQSILLDSIEIKVKAIEDTAKLVYQYYSEYSKEKYYLSDFDKYKILLVLLNKETIYNRFIVDKVEQYIVCNSLKPEWEAKLEPCMRQEFYKTISETFRFETTYETKGALINIFKPFFCMKHLDIRYFSEKMDALFEVDSKIKSWVKSQSILEPFKFIFVNQYKFANNQYDLFKYIYCVIYCGVEWFSIAKLLPYMSEYEKTAKYKFCTIEKRICIISYSAKYIDRIFTEYRFLSVAIGCIIRLNHSRLIYSKYLSRSKQYLLRMYLRLIKLSFYKKDFLGRLRPNTHLSKLGTANKIKHYLSVFYDRYSMYLDIEDIIALYKNAAILFVYWLKKKHNK